MKKSKKIVYEIVNRLFPLGNMVFSYYQRISVFLFNRKLNHDPYIRKSPPSWLKNAVLYQIYPQSYYDSNGDGIGDLPGLIEKLDYIKELGVDALWLDPIFVSPFQDAGYDVADFCKVAPRYGTNDDAKRLFKEADKRGLRVILDLVAGHTSDEHPWFKASAEKEKNAFTDQYIWTHNRKRKPMPFFVKGKYEREGNYRKNFYDCQPALNFGYGVRNPFNKWEQSFDAPGPASTLAALKNVIAFWMDMGASGFRVDMAASLVKRDLGFRKTLLLWKDIRCWFEKKWPEGVLISEWGEPAISIPTGFHIDFQFFISSPGYSQMFLNNSGAYRRFYCYFDQKGIGSAKSFIKHFARHYRQTRGNGYISIPSSNHDFQRPNCGTRESVDELKCAMTFYLTWPGLPTIYYGDEIGMRFLENLPNKEGSELFPGANRAGSRTPMQWDKNKNAGFSGSDEKDLYLPIDPNPLRPDVASQEDDPDSLLNHTRLIIKLRKRASAFTNMGRYKVLNGNSLLSRYPLVYMRYNDDEAFLIVINPSGKKQNCKVDVLFDQPKAIVSKGVAIVKGTSTLTINCEPVSYAIYEIKIV